MKKTALSLLAAGVIAFPALSSAAEVPYFGVSAGVGLVHNSDAESGNFEYKDILEYEKGYALEAALGRKAGMYRGEVAIGYSTNDADKFFDKDMNDIEDAVQETLESWGLEENISDMDITVSVLSVMANGYADFELSRFLTAYLMGGLGYAYVDAELSFTVTDGTEKLEMEYSDNGKNAFAWQLGTGIGLKVTDWLDVDLGYRYFATDDVEIADAKIEYSSSRVMLGMRYNF